MCVLMNDRVHVHVCACMIELFLTYRGSMEWPNGCRYDGEFVHGKIEG